MTVSEDIRRLGELVHRLRNVDSGFRVFGSKQHKYQLGRKLSEVKLSAFESAERVKLSEDYRCFLATVGNGGAGPLYGLEPLGNFGRDLSRPFPLTKPSEQFAEEELQQLPDRDEYPGVLEFCHHGCGTFAYLVVCGPTYGTIWVGREDFFPTKMSFGAWYLHWMERVLRTLENERLVPRLRVGMSKADVFAEVGGDWNERTVLGYPLSFFEAPDFPAQLELDENGVAVKISPWPFI
jgi:hypothetical protein